MKAPLFFCMIFLAGLIPLRAGAEAVKTVPVFPFEDEVQPWKPDLLFTDEQGNDIRPEDFQGEWVLLNIWATWCTPCLTELPSLDRLQKLMSDKPFRVVAVSVDTAKTHEELAAAWRAMRLKNISLYVDKNRSVYTNMKISAIPMSILVSPRGEVLGRVAGAVEWDDPELAIPFLESYLPEDAQ